MLSILKSISRMTHQYLLPTRAFERLVRGMWIRIAPKYALLADRLEPPTPNRAL